MTRSPLPQLSIEAQDGWMPLADWALWLRVDEIWDGRQYALRVQAEILTDSRYLIIGARMRLERAGHPVIEMPLHLVHQTDRRAKYYEIQGEKVYNHDDTP